MKEKYRKTRKSNRIEKEKRAKTSVNKMIGKNSSKFCKKMAHKELRRSLKDENGSITYKGSDFRLKQRLWAIT